jgi:DNA-binding LacI/PurR family transcriptional regulator
VTIVDVARIAGVSVPTVSRVLNKHQNVNKVLRKKVEEAISKTNYSPNLNARYTRTGANDALGIILPTFETNLFTGLLQGAADTCAENNFRLFVYQSNGNIEKDIRCIDMARDAFSCGLIYCPVSLESLEYFKASLAQKIPAVIASRRGLIEKVPHVYPDNTAGCYTATKYLLQQGHRRIAFFAGFWEAPGHDIDCLLTLLESKTRGVYSSLDRLQGYIDALKEFDVEVQKALLRITGYTYESGYESMKAFLASLIDFDAVICANDWVAAGVLQSLREQNIAVPGRVSVVGFDDGVITNIARPTLTSVRQPSYHIGQWAVKTLINLVMGVGAEDIKLDMTLIVRNSTAAKNYRLRSAAEFDNYRNW